MGEKKTAQSNVLLLCLLILQVNRYLAKKMVIMLTRLCDMYGCKNDKMFRKSDSIAYTKCCKKK